MARSTTSTLKKSTTKRTKGSRKPASAPKPGKTVFRTGTWIAILLLAVLIAGAYYLNQNKLPGAESEATASDETAFIFDPASTATQIEVQPAEGKSVKITRGEDGVWRLENPIEAEANQALAEAAATQITALKILNTIDADPSIFGFDTPSYRITITFKDGKTQILEVGDATPTNNGYYVRVDSERMMIASLSGIDAITSMVISPPYLNTPAPLPATPSAAPPPQATVTPTP